jgi:hypothetical protein
MPPYQKRYGQFREHSTHDPSILKVRPSKNADFGVSILCSVKFNLNSRFLD